MEAAAMAEADGYALLRLHRRRGAEMGAYRWGERSEDGM